MHACGEAWAQTVSVCTTAGSVFADFDLLFWLGIVISVLMVGHRI